MEKVKDFFNKYLANTLVNCVILAIIINLIIESLSRQSVLNGFAYLIGSPVVFFYNALIIFATLSVVIFFRRKIFAYIVVSGIWLGLGITNGVILSNRMTPFTTKDLTVLEDGLTIVTNYLSTFEIVLAIAGVAALFAVLAATYVFAPKYEGPMRWKKIIAIFVIIAMATGGASALAVKTKTVDTFFGNLAYAYRDYGMPYCFISTWLNTGIKVPNEYTSDSIRGIFTEKELAKTVYSTENDPKNIKGANVLFLQLESFMDPELFKSIELSETATPYWQELKDKYSSGYLTVPSVGAGTANTEFETICGMSVKFFGPGEYPYKSVLKENTSESYAYDLKALGYATHAIHNHRAVFYGRNQVFANLGFDTFTALEYMNNVVKTPKNWAKDGVLIGEIMTALESTKERDYIYTISVQGHGKYPTEQVIENPAVTVTKAPTEELKWQYEYYVNQMREMDNFIRDLTETLADYKEDTVLVMYGDHIPAIEMTEDELVTGDLYNTEYIIWSNFSMAERDKDLFTYQLGAEVLDRIGIHYGTLTTFHQNHRDSETYLSDLKALEFDMLYGQKYIYNGINPFTAADMKMGVKDIKIKEIVQIGDKWYIKGENFTEHSKISLNGEVLRTIFLGPNILGCLDEVNPEDVANMRVSQVDRNNAKDILSTTE